MLKVLVQQSAGLKGKLRARMSEANAEQIPAPTAAQARELEGGDH